MSPAASSYLKGAVFGVAAAADAARAPALAAGLLDRFGARD